MLAHQPRSRPCNTKAALAGGPSVLQQLQSPWSPVGALTFLLPLTAALIVAETQAAKFPALAEIKDLLSRTMLPIIRKMAWWVCLIGYSAGLCRSMH